MSRIDELIAEYCPDGVEYAALGKLVHRTSNIKWAETSFDEFQYIDLSSVDRLTRTIGDTERITRETAPSRAQQIVREGDVIFGTTRPTLRRFCRIPESFDGQIASTGFCVLRPICERLLPNFLFHTLGTADFHAYVEANERGASYPAISDRVVKNFRMPVPPLEVQREIVRILDQFTELEAELEAELEGRRRQYEHYRRELLTFDLRSEWAALSDVAEYTNGKAHEKLADPDGEIPMVTARFISRNGEANRFVRPEDVQTPANAGDTALVLSDLPNGRALARTFYVDRDNGYAINQRVARLRVRDAGLVDPRFLYRVLDRNPGLLKHDNGVDQTHLSKSQVTGLRFPVPSIADQRRVVGMLEKFDALVNDLSVGLPAELAARRKQYEHYRDRLLTFKELVA